MSKFSKDINDILTCSITSNIMIDPVTGSDGHTYERSAITEWLTRKGTSPITREEMRIEDLVANKKAKQVIELFKCSSSIPVNTILPCCVVGKTDEIQKPEHKMLYCGNGMSHYSVSIGNDPNLIQYGKDIILVIDRSGSMGAAATAKNTDGSVKENGLSVMDITKHAAKTVVHSLRPQDRLAIVLFDDLIKVLVELSHVTETTLDMILCQIDSIKPRGQTNIWGALECAMRLINTRDDISRNGSIIFCTDGIPNISPARGEVETLRRKIVEVNFTTPINFFGFGYNLEKGLLYDLANVGRGMKCFIPDGSMIGTVFVYATSNILSTVAVNVKLNITPLNGSKLVDIIGYDFERNKENIVVNLGTIQYTQLRDLVFQFNFDKLTSDMYTKYSLSYEMNGVEYVSDETRCSIEQTSVSSLELDCSQEHLNFIKNKYRLLGVNIIRDNILRKSRGCALNLNDFILSLEQSTLIQHNLCDETEKLLINFKDQILLAFTPEYFDKWGKDYLDYISNALCNQLKINFKDASIQHFGSPEFEELVERSNDLYDTMDAPKPSLVTSRTVIVSNMRSYNDSSGPCFDGNCTIKMADGFFENFEYIKKR